MVRLFFLYLIGQSWHGVLSDSEKHGERLGDIFLGANSVAFGE